MASPHLLTSDFDDMLSEVHVEIPEASETLTLHHLRRAIIYFCERSKYWQEEIGPIMVVDGIERYDLPTSSRFHAVAAVSLTYEDQGFTRVIPKSTDLAIRYRFWQPTPFEIEVHPNDSLKGKQLSLVAALSPKIHDDIMEVSEDVVRDYHDELVAGTKARLYKMPRKPWTDPSLYAENERIFRQGWKEALRRQARGYDSRPIGAPHKPRSFM